MFRIASVSVFHEKKKKTFSSLMEHNDGRNARRGAEDNKRTKMIINYLRQIKNTFEINSVTRRWGGWQVNPIRNREFFFNNITE